jgi:hypothetical protein
MHHALAVPARRLLVAAPLLAFGALVACGGSTTSGTITAGFDASSPVDAAQATPDAGSEASTSTVDAAPATRNASCTPLNQQTGSAVSTAYGRLDGTLVYVLGVGGTHSCNGDSTHVHLQVEVSGSVYDVAVDIGKATDEVGILEETLAVPGGAWSEGWHGAESLAYPALGVHSTSLPLTAPAALGSQLETLLATTSKISIFCTGYAQGNGCHDVHYKNGAGGDGAIVLDPTSPMSPMLFFRFSTPSF